MAEATSITGKLITNVGELSLYEVKAVASTTETITIPSNIPVTASSKVSLVACNNLTDGTHATSCVYDDANTRFTYTESGASDEDVRILFYVSEN
jgi:hypothetical protein